MLLLNIIYIMLKIFTKSFATTSKNDKVIKKIFRYQQKIKNLIIENNLPVTGYTYSYSFHNKKFNEKEYIREEKEYIVNMNKFYNN
jgi:hypothetical protein